MTNRIFQLWIGEQSSGKTYQLKNILRKAAKTKSIDCVFVCDRTHEMIDLGDSAIIVKSCAGYLSASVDEMPRIVVAQCGTDPEAYSWVFHAAVRQGNCMVALDEAYSFCPAGPVFRGDETLRDIIYSGRHLKNAEGEVCVTHLVVAAQYPMTMNLSMHQQAPTIMCGTVSGNNIRRWIRDTFGDESWERVKKLRKWEFTPLKGRRP